MQVAWIGLGAMGRPMALSALRGGHTLAGYARRPAEHDAIRAAGGTVSDDLRQTVAAAELVCVNLFSEQQLDEVFVEHGVLADIQPGSILAIHSTVSPNFIRGLAQRRRDIDALDAGFSGGPDEASAGKLTLMVGGDAAVLERARPVFATYAQPIVHAGALGTGMTLKVINNLLFAANIALAADALHLVQASGVGLEAALAALMHGSAGSNALGILGRSGHPAAAMAAITRYLEKDVPIALESARGLDLGRLAAATGAFQKADLA